MPLIYPRRLRGWCFIQFKRVLGLGHIVVLSNAGGYRFLVPLAAARLQSVTPSFGTWGTTDFMIGLSLSFPIARWLAGRFGAVRISIAAFVIYAVASFLCAIGETLWLFIPARITLGFAGGITLPVGQALPLDEYPERIRSLGLGIWGMFTLLPFMVRIPLASWFGEYLGRGSGFAFRAVYGRVPAGTPISNRSSGSRVLDRSRAQFQKNFIISII